LAALADAAAKAKSKERKVQTSRHELAAHDIPADSLKAFIQEGEKHYRDAIVSARSKLREARDQLHAMKSGTTNNTLAAQAKSQGVDFLVNRVHGQVYYLFPDVDTKQKCVDAQQKIVDKCDSLVKKLDDADQGMLNYLKNAGPGLTLQNVGEVGFVPHLM